MEWGWKSSMQCSGTYFRISTHIRASAAHIRRAMFSIGIQGRPGEVDSSLRRKHNTAFKFCYSWSSFQSVENFERFGHDGHRQFPGIEYYRQPLPQSGVFEHRQWAALLDSRFQSSRRARSRKYAMESASLLRRKG